MLWKYEIIIFQLTRERSSSLDRVAATYGPPGDFDPVKVWTWYLYSRFDNNLPGKSRDQKI